MIYGSYEEDIKQISLGLEITMIIFFWHFFAGIHVKHQNMKKLGWANFLKFQSTSIKCHPLQTVERNEFQSLNNSLITKLDHCFWNSIDVKTSFSFLKIL